VNRLGSGRRDCRYRQMEIFLVHDAILSVIL
jgi:hypothetical protein